MSNIHCIYIYTGCSEIEENMACCGSANDILFSLQIYTVLQMAII